MTDRLLDSVRSIVRELVREVVGYPARYEYTISGSTNSTVDATPVDSSIGLPPVTGAPLCDDSSIGHTPHVGQTCHIVFLDGNKAKPRCVWTQGIGANPVARLGDQVQSFLPPTLQIIAVIDQPSPGTNLVGTIVVSNPITGTITQGSPNGNIE